MAGWTVVPNPSSDASAWKPVNVPAPAAESPSMLKNIQNSFDENTRINPGDSLLNQGLKSAVHGAGSLFVHPIQALSSLIPEDYATQYQEAQKQPKPSLAEGTVRGLGEGVGGLAAGAALGEVGGAALKPLVSGAGKVASAARTAAIGDEDAAAIRGLRVPANGKKVLPMQSSVQNARPYLQGASSLEDLQSRIPQAKSEVFQPYKDTLDAVGDNPVKGPDGMTTIRALDDERRELSAMNRGLKTGDPSAMRLAEQKGLSQADSLAREKDIKSALYPALSQYGIDPQGIMKDYGSLSSIGKQVEGRSTLLETPQPSGLGKIGQISIKNPLQAPGHIISGMRDLVAGRPMFSMSPSDVGIKEGFANAGPKPSYGRYTPFQPMGQLEAPAIELGSAPEVGGTPEDYRPPNFYHDTTAMRTGRLLNAPPIELGGEVEGPKGTAFRYDTTPMRQGRILPSSVSDDVPLSSHSDIFPDQRPGATRAKPKVIEGRRLKDLTGK